MAANGTPSDDLPIRQRLPGISPKAYEHPADKAATAALRAIPLLDTVIGKLMEWQYERALRQMLLGNSVQLGPDQMPEVYTRYVKALETLDLGERPPLYVFQSPEVNAFAVGANQPMVVLNSGLLNLLDDDEVETVVAHEVGHLLSRHVLYQTALVILVNMGAARLPVVGGLPLRAVQLALLEWSRAAELSCDRAATLVTRDPIVTCRTLMTIAGGAQNRRLNLDPFIRQAMEYEDWGHGVDRARRFLTELETTHAFPVRRVREVMRWVQDGEYDRILRGEYPTRDHDMDPRAAAGVAYDHYSEQFRSFFADTGDQVMRAGDRFNEWLRGGRPKPPDDPDGP